MNTDASTPLYAAASPSVLVIGDSATAMARGTAAVVAADLLVAGRVDLEDAELAIRSGPALGIVFVEIDGEPAGDAADRLDRLLVRLGSATKGGGLRRSSRRRPR